MYRAQRAVGIEAGFILMGIPAFLGFGKYHFYLTPPALDQQGKTFLLAVISDVIYTSPEVVEAAVRDIFYGTV